VNYPQPAFQLVDLGLPSGNLWANCNLGASTPCGQGLYFSWGNTEGFALGDYDFSGTYDAETGLWSPNYGNTQGASLTDSFIAGSQYDAATAVLGAGYVVPSADDFQELFDNTTMSVVNVDEVTCYKFTAENGNYILIPVSGLIRSTTKQNTARVYLWTRNIYTARNARYALVYDNNKSIGNSATREEGLCIRPIFVQQN